jgi:lipopolysaccharide export system permease protein
MLRSSTLSIYVAKTFFIRILAFLVGLVLILQTLDLINESDKVLAAPGATDAALWAYVQLRLPQLIGQFAPFSVLLGALVTMATLAQNSEVIIMKAAGLSPHQILMPMFIVALLFGCAHFAFNETVLVQANDRLKTWQAQDYGASPPSREQAKRSVWVTDGNDVIHAAHVTRQGQDLILENLNIYSRSAARNLTAITFAERAVLSGQTWRLEQGKQTDLATNTTKSFARQPWATSIKAERFLATAVEPGRVSFGQLRVAIAELKAGGHPTDAMLAALYHKISAPLSSILMPLLGAVAAFGLARSGKFFIRLVIGLALGFAYFVADNFMIAMGQFGATTPFLAAWAPFMLFFCIGESVLFQTEE